jgi:hypothetical protein
MEQQEKKPAKKISKEEADRLNNYAQGLDDEITHSVDYGIIGEDTEETNKNA